jgi:hypothetical protein
VYIHTETNNLMISKSNVCFYFTTDYISFFEVNNDKLGIFDMRKEAIYQLKDQRKRKEQTNSVRLSKNMVTCWMI